MCLQPGVSKTSTGHQARCLPSKFQIQREPASLPIISTLIIGPMKVGDPFRRTRTVIASQEPYEAVNWQRISGVAISSMMNMRNRRRPRWSGSWRCSLLTFIASSEEVFYQMEGSTQLQQTWRIPDSVSRTHAVPVAPFSHPSPPYVLHFVSVINSNFDVGESY